MKQKYMYAVYRQYFFISENEEESYTEEWEYVGKTYAVSAKKAISNVRFRKCGCLSESKPIATSAHWKNGYNWKAEVII